MNVIRQNATKYPSDMISTIKLDIIANKKECLNIMQTFSKITKLFMK